MFTTPKSASDVSRAARAILERFASRAYRRPVSEGEVAKLTKLVELAIQKGDSFERGIQLAIQAVLISPQFLFRVELGSRGSSTGATLANAATIEWIGDFELASRLSYFLWSSAPDDELWRTAVSGSLRSGDTLDKQVRRMLRDPKAQALVENFAGQWLQLRNLRSLNPDRGRFPNFDDKLREAMIRETELFFGAVMRGDSSILDLIDSDFTYVNERLARHYGIAGIKGEQFRRVKLKGRERGGLVTQASILTVTSNPTRTSPVKRGKWVLEQLLGTPPPPPPPNVPVLTEDAKALTAATLRLRMEQHRSKASCAVCHNKLDPLGFGLENFDAIGGWRDQDGGVTVDSSGTLPSGESFRGPGELKAILKAHRSEFTRCLTEKMLTYALGRGLEEYDRLRGRADRQEPRIEPVPILGARARHRQKRPISETTRLMVERRQEGRMIMKRPARLSRRTVLRGIGAAIALPWLEAMAPVSSGGRLGPRPIAKRMAFLYVPNGVHMADWTPTAVGPGFPHASDVEITRGVQGRFARPYRSGPAQRGSPGRRPRRPCSVAGLLP